MALNIPQRYRPRAALAMTLLLTTIPTLLVGCGATATRSGATRQRATPSASIATPTPSPTPTAPASASPSASPTPSSPAPSPVKGCTASGLIPGDHTIADGYTVPLPPGTLIGRGNGMTGEVVTTLCDPSATEASINAFMSTAPANDGWHKYTPTTDVNGGCAYVTWVQGHDALAWGLGFPPRATGGGPSNWWVATCARMNPPSA